MSATATQPVTPTATRQPRDARTFWRVTIAILAPIGPAYIAIARFLLPYASTDSGNTIYDKTVAHLDVMNALQWSGLFAQYTVIPGIVAVGWVTRRRAPIITAVAMVFAYLGFVSLLFGGNYDQIVIVAHEQGIDPETTVKLLDALATHPGSIITGLTFVVCHIVGAVLLGTAMLRAKTAPAWVAVLLIASQPLHLISVILNNRPLDLFGWGSTALGFAYAAAALLRMRNDEFDLPPIPRT